MAKKSIPQIFFAIFFHMEQIYKEIPAVGGGLDFLAGGRFRSLFGNSRTPFQSNTTKNTVKIRIGAQKRVWSAGIGDVSIFPFYWDQMRTFCIFGIFKPILDVGDQFGFFQSQNALFSSFLAYFRPFFACREN